jgi:putative oxidoreductase
MAKPGTVDWMTLPRLAAGTDVALLLMRLVTGAFLIHGVWDNIESAERMDEFVRFLRRFKFAVPELMAQLSVWTQFLAGLGFLLGLATRWAGLLCIVNFVVACLMVHLGQDFRGWWPALALVLIGAVLATAGAGRWSVDALLQRRVAH